MASVHRGNRFKLITFDRQQLRMEICSNLRSAKESLRAFNAEGRRQDEKPVDHLVLQIQRVLDDLEKEGCTIAQAN